MKHARLSLFIAFLISGCAASLPYPIDYPLTDKPFQSRDGVLSGRIPQGWFSSDTIPQAVTAWLIKDDFSAVLAFRTLTLDRLSIQRVGKEGLKLLAYISQGLQEGSSTGTTTEPKEFSMRGRKFCSYELTTHDQGKRVVVFEARNKYYECEARLVNAALPAENVLKIYSAQQTILSSLDF